MRAYGNRTCRPAADGRAERSQRWWVAGLAGSRRTQPGPGTRDGPLGDAANYPAPQAVGSGAALRTQPHYYHSNTERYFHSDPIHPAAECRVSALTSMCALGLCPVMECLVDVFGMVSGRRRIFVWGDEHFLVSVTVPIVFDKAKVTDLWINRNRQPMSQRLLCSK